MVFKISFDSFFTVPICRNITEHSSPDCTYDCSPWSNGTTNFSHTRLNTYEYCNAFSFNFYSFRGRDSLVNHLINISPCFNKYECL